MPSVVELDRLSPVSRGRSLVLALFRLVVRRPVARLFGRPRWAPLNGQARRAETIEFLARLYGPDLIVETGTYLGSTTKYLSRLAARLISIEVQASYLLVARLRLMGTRGVTLVLGDSVRSLAWLTGRPEGSADSPLFYLDAHWGNDLPLAAELDAVWSSWPTSLVVIDDFAIPHDPGFGFDDYGDGARIDFQYVNPPADVTGCVPAHASVDETGLRRGTCYLAKGDAAIAALKAAIECGFLVDAREAG